MILRGLYSGTIQYASMKLLSRMTISIYKGTGTLLIAKEGSFCAMDLSTLQVGDEMATIELQELLQ